ncbi:MAG: hypothetical protein Q4C67_01000 [Deinococcus sp.]|nr:hypothetical protein [Deinococcus sp.]
MTSFLPFARPARLRPLLTLALVPLLAACQGAPRLPADHDLSGTISGEWRSGAKLRLNLVGAGFPQALTSTSNLQQNVVQQGDGWSFGVDLPALPAAAGAYQVIAFDDTNGNAKYDAGEPFARNTQFLVFSVQPGQFPGFKYGDWLNIPPMQVSRGWNVYDTSLPAGAANPRPAEHLSSYDLQRKP